MSPHDDDNEFQQLLAGLTRRELGAGERAALEALASRDAARSRTVAELDALQRTLDSERAVSAEVGRPVEASEEADPLFQRLNAAAARAGEAVRARPGLAARQQRRPMGRHKWLLAASFAVLAAVAVTLWLSRGPADLTLGGGGAMQDIVLTPEISAAAPEISWHSVIGARTYDVTISDRDGGAVFVRDAALSASTKWQLSTDQIDELRALPAPIHVRIVARDGVGLPVGTTGDLALTVR